MISVYTETHLTPCALNNYASLVFETMIIGCKMQKTTFNGEYTRFGVFDRTPHLTPFLEQRHCSIVFITLLRCFFLLFYKRCKMRGSIKQASYTQGIRYLALNLIRV